MGIKKLIIALVAIVVPFSFLMAGCCVYGGNIISSRTLAASLVTPYVSGMFAGAMGYLSSSTGTCSSSGASTSWCSGGTFASGSSDGYINGMTGTGGAVDATNGFFYIAYKTYVSKYSIATGSFVGSIGVTTATSGTCPASGVATGWCTGGTFTSSTLDGGFSNALSVAVDATHNYLYVSDSDRVVRVVLSTGANAGGVGSGVATWGVSSGVSSSSADGSYGGTVYLTVDPINQFLYIADLLNNRIVKANSTTGSFVGAVGFITTSTGTCPSPNTWATSWCTGGTFGFSDPSSISSISVDPQGGYIYYVDSSGAIKKMTAAGDFDGQIFIGSFGAGDNQIESFASVSIDSTNGYILAADVEGRLEKYNLATQAFIGSTGDTNSSTGTCPVGVTSTFCTGGSFHSGSGDGMMSLPIVLGADAASQTVFVLDSGNNRVVEFTE